MTRTDKIALSAIFLLLCAAAWMQFGAALLGDKIWLLLAAKMWVQGQALYVDIFEVNPPLILWFYGLAVWVSTQVGFLKDYNVLALAGLALSIVSAWLCLLLARYHPQFAGNTRKRVQLGLLLACLFVFYTRAIYFFDRDHIFFVLTFPYMMRFMPTLARQKLPMGLRLGVGLLAAPGFCIKPYTILVFAALQGLYIARERSAVILWSVENVIVGLFALIYFFCVLRFAPEYIHTVFPMALATYSAFSRRTMEIFFTLFAAITAGVLLADFRPRHVTPYRRDIYYFLAAGIAYFAYALASNGWGYTFHPLMCQLLFVAGWLMWEYDWLKAERAGRGESIKPFIFGQRACALVLLGNAAFMLYFIGLFFFRPVCEWSTECKKSQPFAAYLRQHDLRSFGAFSEDFHRWSWVARLTGAQFDTRYNALWMLPKLVQGNMKGSDYAWIVESVGRGLADDLNRKQPPVVFVDDSKGFFGNPFHVDIIAFFSGVPEFKQAWSHYGYATVLDNCREQSPGSAFPSGCKYVIYNRNH